MNQLDPAVAACRLAVRRCLADIEDGNVLVACSGGADSLALLTAAIFEARDRDWQVIGVVVDHGLQPGSREHTAQVVAQMAGLGADETASISVTVDPGGVGIEAGARQARYAALEELAAHFGARAVLLGHTRDDQAETVLLGLARGSGTRSLAGMRRVRGDLRRPFLDLDRAQTEAACRAEGISTWSDPHNDDPRFTRVRLRRTVLPMLERELGPGVARALARTADQARLDADHLDDLAEAALAEVRRGASLDVPALAALPRAVRTRVLRMTALAAGAPGEELSHGQVLELERLVTDWHGQKWVELPGLRALREGGRIQFRPRP